MGIFDKFRMGNGESANIPEYNEKTEEHRIVLDKTFKEVILPYLKNIENNNFSSVDDLKEKLELLLNNSFISERNGKVVLKDRKYSFRRNEKGEVNTSYQLEKIFLVNNVNIDGNNVSISLKLGIPEGREGQPEVRKIEVRIEKE